MKKFSSLLILSFVLLNQLTLVEAQSEISLKGEWMFRLDSLDIGTKDHWFTQFFSDKVILPGSLDEQGIGVPSTEINMGRLTSDTRYVGVAWYQKEVNIPEDWKDKRISFFLERAMWETQVFVDGIYQDTRNSLSVPHIYELSKALSPGKHIITLRIDNTVKINIGHNFGNMLWTHAITEETQTNWNGVIGEIKLTSTPLVWIEDIQLYPDFEKKFSKVVVTVGNQSNSDAEGILNLAFLPDGRSSEEVKFSINENKKEISVNIPFAENQRFWSEFSPELYQLKASLQSGNGTDEKIITVGIRDFKASGQHFELNGRKIFLRGEVNCAIFPLTGYPPMTREQWLKVFNTYKDYGLNHVRFHSWCPPEAAFAAADEAGFMLQVESPLWEGYGLVGSDIDRAAFILREVDRIIETYGNHPSFCLMSIGNELGDGSDPYLAYLLDYMQKKDSRHLFTSTTHPADPERKDNYFASAGTSKGSTRGAIPFRDFREALNHMDRPLVSHEVGQPAMYPNFNEIEKFTGHLKARYLEVFKKSLEENQLLEMAEDFRMASGKLLVEIYKENIEAQLRTPNIAGFQLLGLQDFPGQGVATVGILDAFLESKGLIQAEEFRHFCGQTVPLLRMRDFLWYNHEIFNATVEIAHYGPSDLAGITPVWKIRNRKGKTYASGEFAKINLPAGKSTQTGSIEASLKNIKNAEQLTVEISVPGTPVMNTWNFWVFPEIADVNIPDDIHLITKWDDQAIKLLQTGKKVLFIPEHERLEHIEKARWDPVFWSYQLFKQPKMMGMICDPRHPALSRFPTAFHSDWQWKNILNNAEALDIAGTSKSLKPIVQFIPDFNSNLKLSAIMEAQIEKGKLLVCNIDLLKISDNDPAARQLLHSLISYMESKDFRPVQALDISLANELFKDLVRLENETLMPDTANAVLHIVAAGNYAVDKELSDYDQIKRREKGFSYQVQGDYFRDWVYSAWSKEHLVIKIDCPDEFEGRLYVHFNDPHDNGRAARIFYCGQDYGPIDRYDRKGVWLEFPVTKEMSKTGITLDARVTGGPDVHISQIILVPLD